MKLTLSRPAEREIDFAIGEIAAGRAHQALRRLCHIRGVPVPAMKEKRRRSRVETLPDGSVKVSGKTPVVIPAPPIMSEQFREDYASVQYERPIRPQPKPARRHVAKDVVADFRAHNTRCCVLGCQSDGEADPHHIWPKGRHGPDEIGNLMPLCRAHHDEIEDIDNEAFRTKYASRLPPTILLKMKLAMMMEADAKLAGREVVDLDAEGM